MGLKEIGQKVNEGFAFQKNQKLTKRKVIGIAIIGLLIIIFFVFFYGSKGGVESIAVKEQDYAEKIIAVGQLGMENQTSIVSQVSGEVDYVGAEAGETVSAGSILISIKNSEQTSQTEQKKAAYLDAQEQYSSLVDYDYMVAKDDLNRISFVSQQEQKAYSDAQTLYKEGAISLSSLNDHQEAYQSAQNQLLTARLKVEAMGPGGAKRNSLYYKLENAKSIYESSVEDEAKYKIKMDWDSVILASYFNVNDTVKSGDVLLDIGQAGTYNVVTDIDEKYFLYVSKGMKADIDIGGQYEKTRLKGEITSITPKINKNTGTFQVKIKIISSIEFQASDLTVNVEIVLKETSNAIVLPNQYLIGNQPSVYVYKGGKAVKTQVDIERGPSTNVIIKKGIKDGDVVLLPVDGMKDGDHVTLKKGVEPD